MTNSTMMTMGIQTSSAKKILNLLEKLLKQEEHFSDEKLKELKSQIRVLREEISLKEAQNSKGFGK